MHFRLYNSCLVPLNQKITLVYMLFYSYLFFLNGTIFKTFKLLCLFLLSLNAFCCILYYPNGRIIILCNDDLKDFL
jgi:hypothetical protein